MERKHTPKGKRATRTLDRNEDDKRGATGTNRGEREQGVALDDRGQEQPSDRRRAHDHGGGAPNKPPRNSER